MNNKIFHFRFWIVCLIFIVLFLTPIAAKSTGFTKLSGTPIGTAPYQNNAQFDKDKAFDGDFNTFFDSNGWVGLDLGTARVITVVNYAPRTTFANRMLNGIIQASNNADFTGAVNLLTITSVPLENVLTTAILKNTVAFRFVRFLSTTDYCSISEIEFYEGSSDEFKPVSGLYNIRLKGFDLYLTAPFAKGNTSSNRITYQPLRNAKVQNCQKWNIQLNQNSGFTEPSRYSFVSGIDGNTDWTEENSLVVGHLDEAGYFRDKNTAETQIGDEGIYHNFTVYFDGSAYGLNDVGLNSPLNISATVSGETVTMNYETTFPVRFLYEFIPAPNEISAINQPELNNLKIMSVENGIRIITDHAVPLIVYNLSGIQLKNCIVNFEEVIALSKGVYIVKSGYTVLKVIVR